MYLLLPTLHDPFEAEATRAFDEHHGSREALRILAAEHLFRIGVTPRGMAE